MNFLCDRLLSFSASEASSESRHGAKRGIIRFFNNSKQQRIMEFLEKDLGSLMEFYTSSRGVNLLLGPGFLQDWEMGMRNGKLYLGMGTVHGMGNGEIILSLFSFALFPWDR
jgi:hypothetical protein